MRISLLTVGTDSICYEYMDENRIFNEVIGLGDDEEVATGPGSEDLLNEGSTTEEEAALILEDDRIIPEDEE
jgi:hypothetical protein